MAKPTYKPTGSFDFNRDEQIRRDDDTTKQISIGLIDHDKAIKYYFDNIIKPSVKVNNEFFMVPVIYGSPERWKAARKDGYFRDKDGKVQYPVIMFRRTAMTKNRNVSRNLDANNPNVFRTFGQRYSEKNNYDRFSLLTGIEPQKEFFNIVVPDYVTLTYECIIWTEYVEQMNKLQESINYAEGSYWGDPITFKFYSMIDEFKQSQDISIGKDRMVKCDFTLKLNGYIVPDAIQSLINHNQRSFNLSRYKIDFNVIDAPSNAGPIGGDIDAYLNRVDAMPEGPGSVSSGDILRSSEAEFIPLDTLLYLRSITVKTASLVDSSKFRFSTTSIYHPPTTSGLDRTSSEDFTFFVNGQYIPNAIIASVTEVAGNIDVTVDTAALGYLLKSDFNIVGIGKFT